LRGFLDVKTELNGTSVGHWLSLAPFTIGAFTVLHFYAKNIPFSITFVNAFL
jgi:hypothetical protein